MSDLGPIAGERLRMLWLAVAASGGKLRITQSIMDEYPGNALACVVTHTDPATGDFIIECRKRAP